MKGYTIAHPITGTRVFVEEGNTEARQLDWYNHFVLGWVPTRFNFPREVYEPVIGFEITRPADVKGIPMGTDPGPNGSYEELGY